MASKVVSQTKPYLTSENDNSQFRAVYDERKGIILEEMAEIKEKIRVNEHKMKELMKRQGQIALSSDEAFEEPVEDKKPMPPKPLLNLPTKPTVTVTEPNDKPAKSGPQQPEDGNQTPTMKPTQSLSLLGTGSRRPKKLIPHLPVTTPLEPGLDKKMSSLLPIYAQQRKIREQNRELEERLIKLENKRRILEEKDFQLQSRVGILHAVKKDEQYLKERKEKRKLGNSMEQMRDSSLNSSNPYLPQVMHQRSSSTKNLDQERLKHARRGLYLDILERATSPKLNYSKDEKKYDIEKAVDYSMHRKDEKKLKYSLAQQNFLFRKAKENPYDPYNAKLLRDSYYIKESLSNQKKNQLTSDRYDSQADDYDQGDYNDDGHHDDLGTSAVSRNLQDDDKSHQADQNRDGKHSAVNKSVDTPKPSGLISKQVDLNKTTVPIDKGLAAPKVSTALPNNQLADPTKLTSVAPKPGETPKPTELASRVSDPLAQPKPVTQPSTVKSPAPVTNTTPTNPKPAATTSTPKLADPTPNPTTSTTTKPAVATTAKPAETAANSTNTNAKPAIPAPKPGEAIVNPRGVSTKLGGLADKVDPSGKQKYPSIGLDSMNDKKPDVNPIEDQLPSTPQGTTSKVDIKKLSVTPTNPKPTPDPKQPSEPKAEPKPLSELLPPAVSGLSKPGDANHGGAPLNSNNQTPDRKSTRLNSSH